MSHVISQVHPGHHRVVAEEKVNQFTHGLATLLAACGSVVLLRAAFASDDPWRIGSAAVYSATLVALYAASTLSHSFLFRPKLRQFFRMADQVCIFLLIAGTYTPFGLVYLREGWTIWLTVGIWTMALVGCVFKIWFSYLRTLTSAAYLLLGWLPIAAAGEIVYRVPPTAMYWVLAGGVLYSVGTLFLANDHRVPFFHAVWHLLVISASLCHFWAVYGAVSI